MRALGALLAAAALCSSAACSGSDGTGDVTPSAAVDQVVERPSPPTNLRADLEGSLVHLGWDAPSEGPRPAHYLVWVGSREPVEVAAAARTLDVADLAVGTSHLVQVASVDGSGRSDTAEIQVSVPRPAPPATVTTATAPEPAPQPAPQPAPAAPPAALRPDTAGAGAVADTFDEEWAAAKAEDVVEDVASVDERLQDGIMVGSALGLLSDSFRRLADAGVPPGADAAVYLATLQTLSDFAGIAADEMSYDPVAGAARYAVIREQTGPVLAQVSAATGRTFVLP